MNWWHNHGTKIIGSVVTVVGGALSLGLVPPQYVQYATWLLTFLGGGAIKRGFTNTANAGK